MQHLHLTAADVMTPDPVTVQMDVTLELVRARMERGGFHHVLVVDGDELVGVLSERDLLRALSPNLQTPSETVRDLATLAKRAHQAMVHHPIVATPETRLGELVDALRIRPIGAIPIVDAKLKPIGIVTWRDLLFAAYPDGTGPAAAEQV